MPIRTCAIKQGSISVPCLLLIERLIYGRPTVIESVVAVAVAVLKEL